MKEKGCIDEVRWHGRGGQGAVSGATILGKAAALYEGKYAVSFPSFGAERRGAPVQAFTRISDSVIRTRSQVYNPTMVVVLDDTLLDVVGVADGTKAGAIVLINTRKATQELGLPNYLKIVTLDASAIAKRFIGMQIVNTTMLGALAAATGVVGIDSIKQAIVDTLPERIAQANIDAAQAAYEEVTSD